MTEPMIFFYQDLNED